MTSGSSVSFKWSIILSIEQVYSDWLRQFKYIISGIPSKSKLESKINSLLSNGPDAVIQK